MTRRVDSAILIDYLRGFRPALDWLADFEPGTLAVSVVTAAELVAGCRNADEQHHVEADLRNFRLVFVSQPISSTAWAWYRAYHLSHGVGFLDCLIGATAQHLDLTLCTRNEKHFRPFEALSLERPY